MKIHKTLRVPPAMQAGLTKRFMSLEDVVRLIPDDEPKKRGSYKKNEADYSAFFIYI
jgi:hypothetical protein